MAASRLPTEEKLRELDAQLAREHVPAVDRPEVAVAKWNKQYPATFLNLSKVDAWFRSQFAKIHPSVNFHDRPFATFCVSALGVSYELNPPMIFGRIAVPMLRCVRIQPSELERIAEFDRGAFFELLYQAADAIDFFHCDLNSMSLRLEVENMRQVGLSQLEVSARGLLAGRRDASLGQGACLAVEAIVKAVLIDKGVSTRDLKNKFGHNLPNLCTELATRAPNPKSDEELTAVAASMPKYVDERYNPSIASIADAQNIYRRALFICAEALRRAVDGGKTFYEQVATDPGVPKRVW